MVPSITRSILVHHRIQSLLRRPVLHSKFEEDSYLHVMVVGQYRSPPQYSAKIGFDHLRATYIKS